MLHSHTNTACTQYNVRRNSLAVYASYKPTRLRALHSLSHSYSRIYLQRALLRD